MYVLTFNMVGSIAELHSENVIDRSAGIQRVRVSVVADESILSSKDKHGSVDEFQSELFIIPWQKST